MTSDLDLKSGNVSISSCCLSSRQVLTAKLSAVSSNVTSASDSSDESSPTGSPAIDHGDGPNEDAESCLPGVVSHAILLTRMLSEPQSSAMCFFVDIVRSR